MNEEFEEFLCDLGVSMLQAEQFKLLLESGAIEEEPKSQEVRVNAVSKYQDFLCAVYKEYQKGNADPDALWDTKTKVDDQYEKTPLKSLSWNRMDKTNNLLWQLSKDETLLGQFDKKKHKEIKNILGDYKENETGYDPEIIKFFGEIGLEQMDKSTT